MSDAKSHKEKNSFLMFGCWNEGFCRVDQQNPLTLNMHHLEKYVKKTTPQFMVVAGDNYYPTKLKKGNPELQTYGLENKEKVSILEFEKLKSGFDCLGEISLHTNIDVIFGNHDLETNLNEQGKLYIKDGDIAVQESVGMCSILENEQRVIEAYPNMNLYLNHSRRFGEKTQVIMLDTSLYSKDAAEYTACYGKLEGKTIEELRGNQEEFVRQEMGEAIKNHIQHLIFIGHHPLVTYKYKEKEKDKTKDKTEDKTEEKGKMKHEFSPSFLHFLKELDLSSFQLYYLCADVHFYQEGTVQLGEGDLTKTIHQYVVGTGGTELDGLPPDSENNVYSVVETIPIQDGSFTHTVSIRNHGFLEVVENLENLNTLEFRFIPTVTSIKGGTKQKKRYSHKKRRSHKKRHTHKHKSQKSRKRS